MKPHLESCAQFQVPRTRKTEVNSAESCQDYQGAGAHMEKLRELGLYSPKKKRFEGILLLSSATEWEVREQSEPNSSQ